MELPLIDESLGEKIKHTILQAKYDGDSVGGSIELCCNWNKSWNRQSVF